MDEIFSAIQNFPGIVPEYLGPHFLWFQETEPIYLHVQVLGRYLLYKARLFHPTIRLDLKMIGIINKIISFLF